MRRQSNELRQALEVLPELIETASYGAALLTLHNGLRHARRMKDFEMLFASAKKVPEGIVLNDEDDGWAVLFARLLSRTRQPHRLLDFSIAVLKRHPNSAVLAHQAWALRQLECFEEGLAVSERCLQLGLEVDLALRMKAETMAALDRPGWREAFAVARSRLTGRVQGLCLLEEGYWLAKHGDEVGALHCFSAALTRFDDDAHYQAWLNHNLGLLCLRRLLPETEAYFLRLQALADHPDAKASRACALNGLGAVRRAYGEWQRALDAYTTAASIAQDSDDQRQAWRGLSLTLRLSGQPLQALTPLQRALEIDPTRSWLYVELAALHAQLGHASEARAALERATDLNGEDTDRAEIVKAVLEHQSDQHDQARHRLRALQPDRLWVREEAMVFPDAFALLEATERPAPLPRSLENIVRIEVQGVLRVQVNGRDVPLHTTGKPGMLLVLLLESPDQARNNTILTHLLYDRDDRASQNALSALVNKLRTALGWKDSVQSIGGAYRLSPHAHWRYERPPNKPVPRFLEGADARWIDDIRRHGRILD